MRTSATLQRFDKLPPVDQLRQMVRAFEHWRESFVQQFTHAQLFMLFRVWLACDWDFYPDRWLPQQVKQALQGVVPSFDAQTERPRFDAPDRKLRRVAMPGEVVT